VLVAPLLLASLLDAAPQWLPYVVLVVIGYYVVRGGGGHALSVLKVANEVLAARVDELERQRRSDEQVIAHLEARTSLEPMVAAVVEQFAHHEARAAERHASLLKLADRVADKVANDEAH
jgi:hypothetical protein